MSTLTLNAAELQIARSLLAAAQEVRLRAYAPYSNYLVGAAIQTRNGQIFAGCNVETANYDGTHAEESALSAMVGSGRRDPQWLLVVGALRDATDLRSASPCGKCRQVLHEFAQVCGHDLGIFISDGPGAIRIVRLSTLLPDAFGPTDVGVDVTRHK